MIVKPKATLHMITSKKLFQTPSIRSYSSETFIFGQFSSATAFQDDIVRYHGRVKDEKAGLWSTLIS